MKKQLLILVLISTTTLAQQNFFYTNTLQWSQVYNDSINPNNYNIHLKNIGATTYFDGELLNFNINFDTKTLENFGFITSQYPTYIQLGGNYSGYIEFKNNKYKATITEIKVVNALDPALQFNISEYVIKKGEIKTSKANQKTLDLLNKYFNNTFTYQTPKDW